MIQLPPLRPEELPEAFSVFPELEAEETEWTDRMRSAVLAVAPPGAWVVDGNVEIRVWVPDAYPWCFMGQSKSEHGAQGALPSRWLAWRAIGPVNFCAVQGTTAWMRTFGPWSARPGMIRDITDSPERRIGYRYAEKEMHRFGFPEDLDWKAIYAPDLAQMTLGVE